LQKISLLFLIMITDLLINLRIQVQVQELKLQVQELKVQ
jgi:hypothetical protein